MNTAPHNREIVVVVEGIEVLARWRRPCWDYNDDSGEGEWVGPYSRVVPSGWVENLSWFESLMYKLGMEK